MRPCRDRSAWLSHVLRLHSQRNGHPRRELRGQDPQGSQAGRAAHRTGEQVRIRREPQDGPADWSGDSYLGAAARRPGDRMTAAAKRRVLLALAMAMLAALARAQSPTKVPRVAAIFTNSPPAELAAPQPAHPGVRAFLQRMRERGYVEGRDWSYDPRSAERP